MYKLSPFFAIIMSCFILKEIPAKREWLLVAGVSAAGGQMSVTAAVIRWHWSRRAG